MRPIQQAFRTQREKVKTEVICWTSLCSPWGIHILAGKDGWVGVDGPFCGMHCDNILGLDWSSRTWRCERCSCRLHSLGRRCRAVSLCLWSWCVWWQDWWRRCRAVCWRGRAIIWPDWWVWRWSRNICWQIRAVTWWGWSVWWWSWRIGLRCTGACWWGRRHRISITVSWASLHYWSSLSDWWCNSCR